MTTNELKKLAAQKSIEEIKSGMVIGLGSGSTVQYALEFIADKIKNGELKNIKGVASSSKTELEAKRLGIPLTTLNKLRIDSGEFRNKNDFLIDLTIDGADEVTISHPDPDVSGEGSNVINLIKGGGGALLREKILAQNSKRLSIIIDESKLSDSICSKSSLPVEVIPFALESEKNFLESLGASVIVRKDEDGNEFVTDEGNFILDANFSEIKNVNELADCLDKRAGIVEHGFFLNMAHVVYCATKDGIKIFSR